MFGLKDAPRRGRTLLVVLALALTALAITAQAQGGVRYFAGTLAVGGDYINPSTVSVYNTRAWTTGAHVCTGLAGDGVTCSGSANEITVAYIHAPETSGVSGRPRCKNIDNAARTVHCWYNY